VWIILKNQQKMAETEQEDFQDNFLKSLGIKTESLQPDERKEIFDMVNDQLQNVVMETMIGSMDPGQLQRFKDAVAKGGTELEAETEKISSEIPGLKERIEEAVAGEMQTIKAGRAQLDEQK
jgi:hypothetical protein